MTDHSRTDVPPLAVVSGAARAISGPGSAAERFQRLCEHLCATLPADEVRLHAGQRRSDRLAQGNSDPGSAACVVDVPWGSGRHAVLEAVGSRRAPAELRPVLETVATLLAAALPALEDDASDPGLERALHRLTIDSLPVGLYVVDQDFRIVLWNRKRETGTQGLRRADVLGRPVFEVLHRQSENVLRAEFQRVFATGEILEHEQEVRLGVSGSRTYRTSRLPMRVAGEEVSHVITIGEDVTESRAMQQAMHQTEKLAAIGQLTAGVMHEVNNPLATIGACVAAISARLGSSVEPVVQEYLDIIESEVGRCTKIVDGLLDFSRAGRGGTDQELVDLNALLERTLFLLKHHQRFRRLNVERNFTIELPAVRGDGERLIQAAMAILLNAADATGGRGTVSLTTCRDGPWAVVELSDDGPGIPADVLPRIFEPFFTTKGPSRGTGLGLAICYGIVADHHGRLEVRSEPGQTTFRIALPEASPEEEQQ